MRIQHVAIDGSTVSIDADADLSAGVSTTGWAVVPSLLRAHPFAIYPPGHVAMVERAIGTDFPDVKVVDRAEFSLKDGTLHIAEAEVPTATGGRRSFTVAAWEGRTGTLVTSMSGSQRIALAEVFDTLQFSESAGGLAIDSPVVAQPRTPQVVKEIPGLGILSIRPAIASELDRVPRSRGFAADQGELFRVRESSDALLFVSDSAVVNITPLPDVERGEMMSTATGLAIEWSPRRQARALAS